MRWLPQNPATFGQTVPQVRRTRPIGASRTYGSRVQPEITGSGFVHSPQGGQVNNHARKTTLKTQRYILTATLVAAFSAFAALLLQAQVCLEPPIITGSNTVRLVVSGPTTNIRYDVFFTNSPSTNVASWPLLATGGTNQVIFDLTVPDTNAGFFLVTSNYIPAPVPVPKVATPVFSPTNFTGNTSVVVTVTCDTPGAAIYYTTATNTPTTLDNYIASANVGGTAVAYTYTADGIRVNKTIAGATTLYLVDDRNPTGFAQVLEELTVTGGATNLAKVFTYGLDLIAQRDASTGTRSFYGYDGNGNTRYLTGTNGAITDTYLYDAFGSLLTSTGSTANDYRYTGEQYDNTLGLYYLRARYLNAGTGRFWTRDAFAGRGDDPASLHRYLYCRDNPANCVDPLGRDGELGSLMVTIAGIATTASGYVSSVAVQVPQIFKIGGRPLGMFFQEVGATAQSFGYQVVQQIQRLAPALRVEFDVTRLNRVIDYTLRMGGRAMDLEMKYRLPDRAGQAVDRLVSQVQASISAGEGQTVIWSLKEPTLQEIRFVMRELGNSASSVQFVDGVEGLFNYIRLYFGL